MEQLNGLNVPLSLGDVCRAERLGLLIYDMQVGILEQIADRQRVIQSVGEVIVPALAPNETEAVLDKLTFSAFAGTALELALRGAGVGALAIVGVATEIGIEPTVRHAGDQVSFRWS